MNVQLFEKNERKKINNDEFLLRFQFEKELKTENNHIDEII